jgi:RNA polymerase sigma factor (sigma-70 family)
MLLNETPRTPQAPERPADADVPLLHVVDDEPSIRLLFEHLGPLAGASVCTWGRAQDFLDGAQLDDGQRPICLVLDLYLPDRNGLDVLRELRARGCTIPAIVISGMAAVSQAVGALKLGSIDFVEKPFRKEEILAAIRRAIDSARQHHQRLLDQASLASRLADLTPRERQVMDLVVAGLPNKGIASQLGISPKTIEVHRANVMRKTGADSLAGLVKLVVATRGSNSGSLLRTEPLMQPR